MLTVIAILLGLILLAVLFPRLVGALVMSSALVLVAWIIYAGWK